MSEDSLLRDVAAVNSISAVPTILDVVCRTTGMKFAAVARVTEDRWVACSVLDSLDFGLKPGGELKLETTICNEIRCARQPVVIDEVREDPLYRDHHTPKIYGFQSYISMPIFLPGGEFFGTLCAIDPSPHRLNTPEVMGMFRLFADLISSHLGALERVVNSEQQVTAERQVSQRREQFIGVLGHDLRSPLGAISMGAVILKESGLNGDQEATVAMMERNVTKIADLVDDIMDLTRGRLGGGISLEHLTDAPLEPMLRQIVEQEQTVRPQPVIECEFAIDQPVSYDRNRMGQLFSNLLSNAMKYGRPGVPVMVRASADQEWFILSVTNGTDPIPQEELDKLFLPFMRGPGAREEKGLGLGLYIASEIAASHGGKLEAMSGEGEMCFTFTMPVRQAA
ncbi:GAF domain-containing sensor histidine kinase [Verrucomicrobium sp. BvORR106]|uniref:GAF domain-containing sensor histidine kinase n=1 Tax=Verrucomicrobium sp. BvORR106 TaxID=1403819 RepID=UPI00057179CD|nr:GAF domain-containing sensor histidine kinase [Verrucomicrobium sp. BvORR106]